MTDETGFDKAVNGVYIPPKGVYFRLYNKQWEHYIYARDDQSPNTGCAADSSTPYDHQFWTLVKYNRDFFALQNKATGKYLESRPGDKWAFHNSRQTKDTRITLDRPKKRGLEGYFQVTFHSECGKRWLRCNNDGFWTPDVTNEEWGNEPYWAMHFEDLEFDNIKYLLDKGTIDTSTPHSSTAVRFDNNGPSKQTISKTIKETVAHTDEFTHAFGVAQGLTVKGEGGVPLIAEGKVEAGLKIEHNLSWGKKKTTSKEYSFTATINVDPWCHQEAFIVLKKGHATVPFVVTYKSPFTGQKVTCHGVWKGTRTWDVKVRTELVERHEPKSARSSD